jgi:hypothetical protein
MNQSFCFATLTASPPHWPTAAAIVPRLCTWAPWSRRGSSAVTTASSSTDRGDASQIPGQKLIPDDARVRSSTKEKDQMVWAWMGDTAKADPATIVDFPYHNDPGTWPNKHDVYPIKANYTLIATI